MTGDTGGGSSSNSGTPSTTVSTSCNTSVVDYGQKGIVTAVGRGAYASTKMIPGTSYPSVAFADAGALAIKFSYWNGSKFITEVVSGDGTGTFVKLVYLSTGIPIVFWAQGTNLKVAIRSAATTTANASWSAGVIDTGTAPRAIEASVNPLDQVGVVFLTNTAVAGRPKFLYCDATCSSPSGFQTMTPNAYIENTNVVAAVTGTGFAWCKVSGSSYYPAVTYSVTGITRYAVCRFGLSSCLNSANWTTQTIVATGNPNSKLYIDQTTVGDVAKVVSANGTSGIVTYKMGTTACTAAPAAFSAGSTLGGATTGTQWLTINKDGTNGYFHVLANLSTTAVSYFNNTSTDHTTSWNAVGTVETNTLNAATGSDADIDTATLGIYSAYGINAAPFDLKLARVADYTVASNSASAIFTKFLPDLSGDMQLAAAGSQQKNIAVASTASGRPAVAYVDFSIGAAASAKLKFALRNGATSSDTWTNYLIPDTANPQFPSLAFDNNNRPWIGYFDAAYNRFRLVTNSAMDGSGVWRSYDYPALPAGGPVGLPAANETAVVMYNSGGVSYPVMFTIDTNAGTKGVKATRLNPNTHSWYATATIDGLTGGALGASHISAASDSSGNIIVGYRELNVTRARYAYSSDGGITWTTPMNVSAAAQGVGVSVAINPSTSKPAMSYLDRAGNSLYYASCSGTFSSCATGSWTATAIDTSLGISGLANTNEQLLTTDLHITTAGNALILFPKGQAGNGSLNLATNQSGSWVVTTASSGASATLSGTAALNFANAGWSVSGSTNATGSVTGVHVGPGNWLYATSCGD